MWLSSTRIESNRTSLKFARIDLWLATIRFARIEHPLDSIRFDSIGALATTLLAVWRVTTLSKISTRDSRLSSQSRRLELLVHVSSDMYTGNFGVCFLFIKLEKIGMCPSAFPTDQTDQIWPSDLICLIRRDVNLICLIWSDKWLNVTKHGICRVDWVVFYWFSAFSVSSALYQCFRLLIASMMSSLKIGRASCRERV